MLWPRRLILTSGEEEEEEKGESEGERARDSSKKCEAERIYVFGKRVQAKRQWGMNFMRECEA